MAASELLSSNSRTNASETAAAVKHAAAADGGEPRWVQREPRWLRLHFDLAFFFSKKEGQDHIHSAEESFSLGIRGKWLQQHPGVLCQVNTSIARWSLRVGLAAVRLSKNPIGSDLGQHMLRFFFLQLMC